MRFGGRLAASMVLTVFRFGLACGGAAPPAFTSESQRASDAYRRGEYLNAARAYLAAAGVASRERDADEARFRAAQSWERAARPRAAASIYQRLAAQKGGERSARAAFALARLSREQGDTKGGEALRSAAIERHPNSGLSASELWAHLDYLQSADGLDAALSYLTRIEESLPRSELAETCLYFRGRLLEAVGRAGEARDAYVRQADRYPYPSVYWDDALFRAGVAEEALGQPELALAHFERLLREQEDAEMTGSYQRTRYAEAEWRVAEIYRDALRDPLRARRAFRKVWLLHPTSRLADDALFAEALVAKAAGDESGVCPPLELLRARLPESRYAACADRLCAKLGALPGRACHDYLLRNTSRTP